MKTEEILTAELTLAPLTASPDVQEDAEIAELNCALDKINAELARYTNAASKVDYEIAVASGILSGLLDALIVGKISITEKDIILSHKEVNNFIQKYADSKHLGKDHLNRTIASLEKEFTVAQDNVWKGAGIGVSAKNHHLADLAHHPTPLGLLCAIIVQFLRVGIFVNKDGEWHFIRVESSAKDLAAVYIPAVITGLLNWLVFIGEKYLEEKFAQDEQNTEIPAAIKKLAHLVASAPLIIEFAKCANNWFGHLVSDMGGSKNTPGGGMGIPGLFISLLYEFSALPGVNKSGLPKLLNTLYEKQKIDLRHEIPLYKMLTKQTVPVAINEIIVRLGYFLSHLAAELRCHNNDLDAVKWDAVVPLDNRTVDHMLMVSGMTFTIADTTDAALHAAIESGGNWVLFAGGFAARFNYVGAGRAVIAVVKEVSNEHREAQIVHEKMLLEEDKAALYMDRLQSYKAQLEERLSLFLAEDIGEFMCGIDFMKQGISSDDSDMVIKGSIVIQRVLGREPQFLNQEEFDELMDSDIPLVL